MTTTPYLLGSSTYDASNQSIQLAWGTLLQSKPQTAAAVVCSRVDCRARYMGAGCSWGGGGRGGVGGAADHLNTYTVSRFYPYHSFLFVPCSHQFHIRTILSEPVNEAITADLNMRMVAKHGSSKYTDQLADMTVSSSSLTYQIGPDAKKMMFKEGSSGCTDEGGGGGVG